MKYFVSSVFDPLRNFLTFNKSIMKTLGQKGESTWSELPVRGNNHKDSVLKWISVLLTFAIFNLTIGCRSYFKVRTSAMPTTEAIAGISAAGKTVVIHWNEKKWFLSDVQVKNNTVTGKLEDYKRPPTIKPVRPDRINRYYARNSKSQQFLLSEVHLYVSEFADSGNDRISIPVKSVFRMEIYNKDKASTIISWSLVPFGITVGTLLALVLVLALTSCPFIYTWDGENYQFAGEIYSGAIHKPLERNDYLKLPTYPGQQSYSLKVSNEVQEIQNTNMMELLVFDHPQSVNILVDKYGKVTTLSQPVAPSLATALSGENVTKLLTSKDNLFYQSKSTGGASPLKDGVILEFPGPGTSKTAKLEVRAKNSVILDYALGKFHAMFGSAFNKFEKKQQKSSADQMRQWSLDQGIPLSLFVERSGKWEFVDYYNIAGPLKYKDDVLSIPLNGKETNPLKVKLEFGNFLWEIDYAAIDYSPGQQVTSHTIPVKSALDEAQKDVSSLLAKDDTKYYTQPTMTNQAIVTFDLPKATDQYRTVILHSKGWYQVLRNPEGKPDVDKLKTFKQPGRFNQFVNEQIKTVEQLVAQP